MSKAAKLRRRFPQASQGFLDMNNGAASIQGNGIDPSIGNTRQAPIVERDRGAALHPGGQDEDAHSAEYLVRVTSVRKRLLDEDNLCEKFHIDGLRYAGLLPDDAPAKCRIETTQRLCRGAGEEEKTIIELFRRSPSIPTL